MNGFNLELNAMVALREREMERDQTVRQGRLLAALAEVVTRAPLRKVRPPRALDAPRGKREAPLRPQRLAGEAAA